MLEASFALIGYTPHSIDNCLLTFSFVVAAMIGDLGLNFEIFLAVSPHDVAAIITFAFKS